MDGGYMKSESTIPVYPKSVIRKIHYLFLLENTVFSSNKEVAIVYNAKKQGRVLTY